MALKKVNKQSNDAELKKQLMEEVRNLEENMYKLQDKIAELKEESLKIDIKPFKIGGYAIALIPSGRSAKEQKCLLECENGTLYVRPIKEDGELSGRHFSIIPIDNDYSKHLKEVK